MVILAGKFICGPALKLQCRILLFPWVKRNSVMSCSKVRDYGSSFPVRYINKNSPKTQKLQTSSPPMNDYEDKEKHNGSDMNALRVDYSDGGKSLGRSFSLDDKLNQNQRPSKNLICNVEPEVEEESDHKWGIDDNEYLEEPEESVQEHGIHQGTDASELLAFQAGKTKQDAEKMAIEFLATRAFTTVELRKKLLAKRCPLDVVDAVIADFQIRGLINDCLYAETFSRSRFSSSSWGPRRIKQALFRKGVSEVDAEKAIKLVFKDGESGEDQESRLGLSKLSLDHLFFQASKQWLRGQDVPSDKRKSRIIMWLQYRGFNWGVVSFVLKKLESEYPP